MYANSNEDIVFKFEVSLEQGGKIKLIESLPRLGLISFKTFHLNLKKNAF